MRRPRTTRVAQMLVLTSMVANAAALGCGASAAPSPSTTPTRAPTSPSATNPGTASSQHIPTRYQLRLAEVDGEPRIAMTLWMPPLASGQRADLPRVPGRAARREQIRSPSCSNTQRPGHPSQREAPPGEASASTDTANFESEPVPQLPGGGWQIPAGCSRLHYHVALSELQGMEPRALLASHRREPSQSLLPGAAIFVVPDGLQERPMMDFTLADEVIVTHQLSGRGRIGLRLPPRSSLGRVLFSIGSFDTHSMFTNETSYLHLMDDPGVAPLEGFEEGVSALHRMTGGRPPSQLHAYWIGRPRSSAERLAGVTGLDAVVVNYWSDLEEGASDSTRRSPLAVFFQQYFVSLAGPRVPAWLSESMGQYVALLAWRAAGAIGDRGLARLIRASAPRRPTTTLLDAYRRWEESGAEEDYRRFYFHGLGFWSALDEALKVGSHGESSLTDVVEALLGLVYLADGRPPERFIETLEEAGADVARSLCDVWLGQRDVEGSRDR